MRAHAAAPSSWPANRAFFSVSFSPKRERDETRERCSSSQVPKALASEDDSVHRTSWRGAGGSPRILSSILHSCAMRVRAAFTIGEPLLSNVSLRPRLAWTQLATR